MAANPGTIVTSLLFLLMAQDSWQQRRDFTSCPTDSLDYPDEPENLPLASYNLFTTSNARLELVDSGDGHLGLTTTSGTPTVFIAKNLDYEVKTDISGSVRCFDTTYPNGITLTVHITVQDVNEFPPQFKNASYSVSIGEDTAPGSTVFRFKGEATDRDATPNQYISYSAVPKNPHFSIANSQEGSIVLGTPLDFENGQRTFVLNISANESTGNPRPLSTTTTLTIYVLDVDDLGPVFSNTGYTLTINEGTYNGQQYQTVPALAAVDEDTLRAVIIFALDASSRNQFGSTFEVKTDGAIAVNGAVYPGNFTINVRAFQQNRPYDRFIITTVFVSVRDINDNSPSMSRRSYTAEVSEEARPGSFVVAVSATDLDQGNNAHFLFHLDNNNNNVFNISTDGTLGTITVAGRLDSETQEIYILQVYAQEDMTSERRNSSKSAVIITIADANDNSPVFQSASYSFSVKQTDAAGQVVGRVIATDLDKDENGRVTFSITSPSGAFRIDSNTGQITTQRTLTKADVGLVSLLVKADDNAVSHQRSTVAQVTVNVTSVNQFSQFINPTSYNFSVNEDAPVGFSVGTVQATDWDGDNLQYSLQTADAAFELRGDPPTLYVKQPLDLDVAAPKTLHVLQVWVTDGNLTASASVAINVQYVNEFSPSFSQSAYYVSVIENATRDTSIVQLSATDGDRGSTVDGTVGYSIAENKDTAPVVMNAVGLVTLNCDGCLDYNVKSQYLIVVEARDGGSPPKTAVASVIVSVQDINNKAPRFEFQLFLGTVQENVNAGHTIMKLQAHDDDTATASLVYTVVSGNAVGLLRMAGSNLVTSVSLDAERYQFVTGVVRVSDGVNSDTTNINITVVDVNDNDPQLTLTPNPVRVPENTGILTRLPVQITAIDWDITENGFTLWLEGSAGKFSINRTSGDVTVVGAFDRRQQLSYDVQVYVSDNGSPPRFSSTTLRVDITDSNTAPVLWDSSNRTSAAADVVTTAQPTRHHDVTCLDNRMSFSIPFPGNLPRAATLSDPRCHVDTAGGNLMGSINLNSCGTTVAFTNDSVIFRNVITITSADNSTGEEGLIPIQCKYDRFATVQLSYMPVVRHVLFTEVGIGQLSFRIQQFRDASYLTAVADSQYPLRMEPNERVYIQLSLGDVLSAGHKDDIGINVQECVASPFSTLLQAQSNSVPLIQESCPASNDVQLMTIYPEDIQRVRFSFKVVSFPDLQNQLGDFGLVFVHCRVSVCPADECSASNRTCPDPSAIRRVRRSAHDSVSTHQLSTGPFLVSEDKGGAVSSTTALAAVSMVVAAIATVVAMVAVVAWRRSRREAIGQKC